MKMFHWVLKNGKLSNPSIPNQLLLSQWLAQRFRSGRSSIKTECAPVGKKWL